MNWIAWLFLGFFCGALPFSLWIGRLALGADIRAIGDGNPGATNVLRAGGRAAAAAALLLDFFKGALPVGLAYLVGGLSGLPLVAVALAPVVGHAFSPLLAWRGGKAVAVTGGVWCGLTAWEGPTVGGLMLGLGVFLFGANGWAVLSAMGGLLVYLLLAPPDWNGLLLRPDRTTLLLVWLGNAAILAWKHRNDLAKPPRLPSHRKPIQ